MRCPKCGYISFDHLETCLKCKKNIKSASDSLSGTVYNVSAPTFLKFAISEAAEGETSDFDAFVTVDDEMDSGEIQDPDLDILIDDSTGEDSAGGLAFEADEDAEFTLDIDGDEAEFDLGADKLPEDEAEISLDMDLFGDEEEEFAGIDESDASGGGAEEDETFSMDLPEELSDMSDLEPPPAPAAGEGVAAEPALTAADEDFSLDLNLDDVGSGDLGVSPTSEETLSLDDDLSVGGLESPAAPAAEKKSRAGKLNLDDDLDFELDLGDLTLDDK